MEHLRLFSKYSGLGGWYVLRDIRCSKFLKKDTQNFSKGCSKAAQKNLKVAQKLLKKNLKVAQKLIQNRSTVFHIYQTKEPIYTVS